MKRQDGQSALGYAIFATLFVVLVLGGYILAAADLKLWQPWAINQQTKNIRHSIGYVDAQNAHARDDINEYFAAKATTDTAHMNALLNDLCATVGQLRGSDEVAPDVARFIAAHPCAS